MEVIKVNKETFKEEVLKSDLPVLVDFNADWCGPCRMLEPILEDIAKDNETIKFASINVDESEDLAAEYNVFSIPCLVLFNNGKEEKRNVGFMQKEELKTLIGE
jgi:thioredoxin 1